MAISPGLAWSLANGISQQEYDQNIFNAIKQGEAQGLTDANFRSQMTQYGISAEDVARVTRAAPSVIQQRFEAATPTTAADIAFNNTAMTELAGREAQNQQQIAANQRLSDEQKRLNEIANQQQIAANQRLAEEQKRLNEIANQKQIAENQKRYQEEQRLNQLASQQQIADNQKAYQAYLQNQQQLAAQQAQTNPFANVPVSTLDQNFQNYTSIPIGAQYNPGVTSGGASPYSQVMGQMRPMGNPYAGVISNQPMGGYDPGMYERERQLNIALRDAGVNPYGGVLDQPGMGGGAGDAADGGFGFGGDGSAGASVSGTPGWAKGGLVDRVAGPDPAGPDDGYGKLKVGEYVIKKSSVNKYGKGLLDMLNDGKVSTKKMKSLLG